MIHLADTAPLLLVPPRFHSAGRCWIPAFETSIHLGCSTLRIPLSLAPSVPAALRPACSVHVQSRNDLLSLRDKYNNNTTDSDPSSSPHSSFSVISRFQRVSLSLPATEMQCRVEQRQDLSQCEEAIALLAECALHECGLLPSITLKGAIASAYESYVHPSTIVALTRSLQATGCEQVIWEEAVPQQSSPRLLENLLKTAAAGHVDASTVSLQFAANAPHVITDMMKKALSLGILNYQASSFYIPPRNKSHSSSGGGDGAIYNPLTTGGRPVVTTCADIMTVLVNMLGDACPDEVLVAAEAFRGAEFDATLIEDVKA